MVKTDPGSGSGTCTCAWTEARKAMSITSTSPMSRRCLPVCLSVSYLPSTFPLPILLTTFPFLNYTLFVGTQHYYFTTDTSSCIDFYITRYFLPLCDHEITVHRRHLSDDHNDTAGRAACRFVLVTFWSHFGQLSRMNQAMRSAAKTPFRPAE